MSEYDHRPRRLTVIIPNYNYERFVGAAIESALAIDWPDIEIIVVDDGSTDGSRTIIESYCTKDITGIFQANAGPASAAEAGFECSSGDLVLFLDADDLVDSDIMQLAMQHWRAGISKFQFQMKTIDADGQSLGSVFPRYPFVPSSRDVRRWALTAGADPTPPGSGNLYTRSFLQKIFPLEQGMDRASDSYCLSTAPFLGDVITVVKPVVSYRIHDNNLAAMGTLKPEKFGTDLARTLKRMDYASRVAKANGVTIPERNLFRSLKTVHLRIASYILAPDQHPIIDDSRWSIFCDASIALFTPQGYSLSGQIAAGIWGISTVLLPRSVAERLLTWRYVPAMRPRWLKRAIGRS